MLKWGWVAVVVGITSVRGFSEQWTVDRLGAELQKGQAGHVSDKALAGKLSTAELSEQLTHRTLEKLEERFHVGSRTVESLELLSAESALLDPPPGEHLEKTSPDEATREAMVGSASRFAAVTLHHMPDFTAKRRTRAFDDAPPPPREGTGYVPAFVHIHIDGTYENLITYRGGREVNLDGDAESSLGTKRLGNSGLYSTGEFGPMLGLVLTEGSSSQLEWLRWEELSGSQAAVFHYAVSKAESKFRINLCCLSLLNDRFNFSSSDSDPIFDGRPAYEGEIYIDPENGVVLRITVQSLLEKLSPLRRAGLAIEYGPVEIGGHTYICPIRSVADVTVRTAMGRTLRHINLVEFKGYRRFGSESRILAVPKG